MNLEDSTKVGMISHPFVMGDHVPSTITSTSTNETSKLTYASVPAPSTSEVVDLHSPYLNDADHPYNPNETSIPDDVELTIIENQMKQDEVEIEKKIKNADDLSDLVGQALKLKLEASLSKDKDKGQANIIFAEGMSDMLQAQSRLLGISIDGKCKVSAIRKARYAMLKAKSEKSSGSGFTIENLLNS